MTRAMPLALALLASCACGGPTKPTQHVEPPADAATSEKPATPQPVDAAITNTTPMPSNDQLNAIRNDNIDFATYTPEEDLGKAPPGLYRQLSVTAPPEAFALTRSGDMRAFDVLVPMLDDPDRNWAAFVMLAALTGHEAANVIAFGKAQDFKGTVGARDARKNWEAWLADRRAKLQWDATRKQFVAK
ncbi:MAG TPA: hypothetical protein VL326_03870 [Kofleriaceae bacterium]|jgi:hypothetical protein|nr:hypothetical protein [Kofleriaceae bacterium]